VSKVSAYALIGIDMDGNKEVLGIYRRELGTELG
jgi:transposase-like protein